MSERGGKYLLTVMMMITILVGCHIRPTGYGQQYKDGHLEKSLSMMNKPSVVGKPINAKDYFLQVDLINQTSPGLYNRNNNTFDALQNWMLAGADTRQLGLFGLNASQMAGVDNFGNVQFTGYYTPVVQARHIPQGEFRHPLYRMPSKSNCCLPNRAQIYGGALNKHNLVIAYTNSLVSNFMMEIQGSGYVDFGDGKPLTFFGYGGKNGHPYRSIGKILIERGEIAKKDMSMQAIRKWAASHNEAEVRKLLEQNPSFVFFRPAKNALVTGASAVPLVAKASVAADRLLIPAGTTLLAEVPLLNNQGKFTGQYQMHLMVALDVGGAIKGHHFDIYHGIGHEAGQVAGLYNHYGRVWVLQRAGNEASFFAAYQRETVVNN